MKSIAIILFLVFSGTILVPVAESLLYPKHVTLFIVDEEKSSTNQLNEIKETKHFANHLFVLSYTGDETISSNRILALSKTSLPASPILESLTPPPNFY